MFILTGVIESSVVVTMVHEGKIYVIAGHGNVPLPIIDEKDGICPCNATPGNVLFIKDVTKSKFKTASSQGLCLYLGGRFKVLPKISMCYLAFKSVTESSVLKAMEQCMHAEFPKFDTLLTEFVIHAGKASCLTKVIKDSNGVAFVEHTNVKTNKVTFKEAINSESIIGITKENMINDASVFLNSIHPDDQDKFREAKLNALQTATPLMMDVRVIVDGETKHLYGQSSVKKISDDVYEFVGFALDVTDKYALQKRHDALKSELVDCSHQSQLKKVEFETAKKIHLEHEDHMTHHFKNSFIAIQDILKHINPDNLNDTIKQVKEVASQGVITCMRGKALKLIQYGQYHPVRQWLPISVELNVYDGHNRTIKVPTGLLVYTDETLLKIIIQNLISNATQHGKKDGPITIVFQIENDKVVLTVTNECNCCKGTIHHDSDCEFGKHTYSLHEFNTKHTDSLHEINTKYPEPVDHFESFLTHSREKASSNHGFSQGIGLAGIKQCGDILGASIYLYPHPQTVVAKVVLQDQFKFSTKKVFDIPLPVIACLDDSGTQRKLLQRLCTNTNASKDSFVLGESNEEIDTFADRVMQASPPVTHCIIDQNLENPVPNGIPRLILGTSIMCELRKKGFKGKLIVRSANDTSDCMKLYLASGADTFMSKSSSSKEAFVQVLTEMMPIVV